MKRQKSKLLILMGALGLTLLFAACSGAVAKLDTQLGKLEFGQPFGYKYSVKNECHLPFRWAGGSEMTTEDLNFIISEISIRSQGAPCRLNSMPLGFGNDSYDWDLNFYCDCREKEVWLVVDGEPITSLGKGKIIGK